jgi:alpha-mannosidase
MWPMGDDFAYENANSWYNQMDKLIHYVNMVGFVGLMRQLYSLGFFLKNSWESSAPLS